jgi:hypothetical protein
VELRPEDPTLNDHLGDAFWRVGRRREAYFQWRQALTLKPEPEEVDKINRKLEDGLPDLVQGKPVKPRKVKAQRPAQERKRASSDYEPVRPGLQ